MTILVVILASYVAVVAFVLLLVRAVKRTDEALATRRGDPFGEWHEAGPAAPATLPPVKALPRYEALGRLVADVAAALGVRHVAVVVRDGASASSGTVAAWMTEVDDVRSPIRIATNAGAAVLEDVVAALGIDAVDRRGIPWKIADVPIISDGLVLGLIVVAERRPREFTDRDMAFLRRLARRATPELQRARAIGERGATA